MHIAMRSFGNIMAVNTQRARNIRKMQVMRIISGMCIIWITFLTVRNGEEGDFLNMGVTLGIVALNAYNFLDLSERIYLMKK